MIDNPIQNNVHANFEQESTRGSFLRRLRMIPKFNGDSFQDLKDFIDITETLYFSCINRAEEQELFEHMVLQLRGKAKSLVSRLNDFDFETIKNSLLHLHICQTNLRISIRRKTNLCQNTQRKPENYCEKRMPFTAI